ncbi:MULTISPECIES: GspH/FimT family protein [unclassified Acidovorax]|uniref:GspH/FimT family pseudopilin n=1 Tax=unclassified Acidovorax TaxID=2684926 RepID=UPI000BC9936B|nr:MULTISPECIES: GspH/FimT family protein [unclassified Acidovorax]OYY84979.1 MAG: general secretion pathway protein GspH [Acidovorax sp. 28-64-14]OYZ45474.1 MAG: general secretion pathway protein GspH [Acidovorax sp. 16-64-162]OZA55375.1 MAG: general secretion pathway protein GspH [Acidovorax sp. 17-64-282]HQS19526.1 GspH/FimT family protein [Acidovorax defluvii]OYY29119.1 MAG: general secretion pathway protein GspH [Acidovorax sp. 35-64-16]
MPFFLSAHCATHLPPRTRPHRQARGFTLLEVMVVVAIIAVLAAIAAPSFTPLIERWRVRQAVEGLQSTLYFARSEAIKRGGNITIRKEPTGSNGCALASGTNSWDCGWFVFVDTNGNGAQDSGEELLQRFATPPNIEVTRTSGGANIKLNRWGLVDGTWLGFSLVPLNKNLSDPAARGVCMSSGGRIRVITDLPCTSG